MSNHNEITERYRFVEAISVVIANLLGSVPDYQGVTHEDVMQANLPQFLHAIADNAWSHREQG